MLAAWLLESAGLPNDGALRTVCRPDPSSIALDVTWAREAAAVVALWEDGEQWRSPTSRRPPHDHREPQPRGEPSDKVEFDLADLESSPLVAREIGEQFHLRGALARCAQVSGAMDRVVELVLTT